MIHQHIFAMPRPGLSVEEFQDYWRYEHALKFAVPIKQVKKYKIDIRLEFDQIYNQFNYPALAEIWLKNEKEQTESLLSSEYINGAKLDEKRWASTWQTLVLDTDSNLLLALDIQAKDTPEYKLLVIFKRKEAIKLHDFRTNIINTMKSFNSIGNVVRNNVCFVRDKYYENNEPCFDVIGHISLDSYLNLKSFINDSDFKDILHNNLFELADPFVKTCMAVRSDWIVGPEPR